MFQRINSINTMEYEIFTICDNAQNYNGKMVIVGTFDTIFGQDFPLTYEAFSLAVKINCPTQEFKDGKLQIFLKEKISGKNLCPPITTLIPLNPNVPEQVIALAVNFQKIVFLEPGKYTIEFHFNNDIKKRDLRVVLQENGKFGV